MKHLGHSLIAVRDTPFYKAWRYKDDVVYNQRKRLPKARIKEIQDKLGVELGNKALKMMHPEKSIQLVKLVKETLNIGLYETSVVLKSIDMWPPTFPQWTRVWGD